jgi:hypothetical protein
LEAVTPPDVEEKYVTASGPPAYARRTSRRVALTAAFVEGLSEPTPP